MENLELIRPEWLNSFLGFIMPIIVKQFVKSSWTRRTKTLFAILISTIIGFISVYIQGEFLIFMEDPFYTILEIFSVSQIAYNLFWKNLFEKNYERR